MTPEERKQELARVEGVLRANRVPAYRLQKAAARILSQREQKAARRTHTRPGRSRRTRSTGPSETQWRDVVRDYVAEGLNGAQAAQKARQQHPRLWADMLTEANRGRPNAQIPQLT